MRPATANILSFGLDAGWGTSPGVQSRVLIAPKGSRRQNPNVQFERSAGYAFSRVPLARIDRAVALEPAGNAATATQEIAGTGQISGRKFAGSRFDRTVRVRHEGIDKEAG